MTGYAPFQHLQLNAEIIAIVSVDPLTKMAKGLTRERAILNIDCNFPVGGIYTLPAEGEQWYVDRLDNSFWKLHTRIPFNDNNTLIEPVPGQTIIGSTGPVVLNGSNVDIQGDTNINGALGVGSVTLKEIDGSLKQSTDGGATWEEIAGTAALEDITGLQEALDGLQTEIETKADTVHTHPVDDITGLDTILDGKSDIGHTHTESEIAGLDTALAGKADIGHTHDGGTGAALDPDLIDIGALTPLDLDFIQRVGGHWTNVPASTVKSGLNLDFLDIGGILSGGQIPGLDCSKITSGTFLQSLNSDAAVQLDHRHIHPWSDPQSGCQQDHLGIP